jgi:hypothetical protein
LRGFLESNTLKDINGIRVEFIEHFATLFFPSIREIGAMEGKQIQFLYRLYGAYSGDFFFQVLFDALFQGYLSHGTAVTGSGESYGDQPFVGEVDEFNIAAVRLQRGTYVLYGLNDLFAHSVLLGINLTYRL